MIALPILLFSLIFARPAHAPQPSATPAASAGASAASPSAPATLPPSAPSPAADGEPTASPPATGPSPMPATASPAASAAPSAPVAPPSASPPATATPGSAVGESPSPYKYRFVPHVPGNVQAGQPVIVAIYLNSQRLRSEGPILIKVDTNEAVVKVVSRSNGHEGGLPRVRSGEFEAAGKVPKLPVIAHGMTVDLEFIATSADGRKTSVRVPIKLD